MNELIAVPMKDSIVRADLVDKKYRSDMAMLIPIVEGQPYTKSTTEAAVNTMWKMTQSLRPNKSRVPYDQIHTGKTDDEVHEELMALIKGLADLMQRIVHSSSWRNGDFASFDKAAFDRQLELLTLHTSDL